MLIITYLKFSICYMIYLYIKLLTREFSITYTSKIHECLTHSGVSKHCRITMYQRGSYVLLYDADVLGGSAGLWIQILYIWVDFADVKI